MSYQGSPTYYVPGTNLANKDSLEEKSDEYGLYVLVVRREAINKQTL